MTGTGAAGQTAEDKRQALVDLRLRQQRAARAYRERIGPAGRGGPLPLTWQQEGLWFLHVLNPGSATYHMPVALRLRGVLDAAALRQALCGLVRRHESLRTRFGSSGGVPFQLVDEPPDAVELQLAEVPGAGRERVAELVGQEARRPFDLAGGWGMRCWLARLGCDDHVLVLTMHHIVTDGWSVGIVLRDLAALYAAARSGGAPPDVVAGPAPRLGPADFAVWQREWLTGPVLAGRLGFWRERLAGAPVLEIPADRPRPAAPSGAGTVLAGAVPAAVGARLAVLAAERGAERGASLLAVLAAAFFVVLHRYTGQEDLVIGSVLSGRTRSEIEPLVGFFANTVVLRGDVAGDPSLCELADRCGEVVLDALGYQDVPFAMVVDALAPPRVAGRNPLFGTSLSLLPEQVSGGNAVLDGLAASPVPVDLHGARFDLRVELAQRPDGGLGVWVEYSTELFDADRVERLIAHFRRVLGQAAADPSLRVSQVELLDAAERAAVERFSRGPAQCAADRWRPVPQVVADRAGQAPDRVAVSFGREHLCYRELAAAASRLARLLHARGVRRGDAVGVCGWRCPGLVVALLAVLRAGAAYIPLDPETPAVRLAAQAADARVAVAVIAGEAGRAGLPGGLTQVNLSDPAVRDELAGLSGEPVPATIGPDDLAYVMFTSGSTGTPKGVGISHGGLANRLWWMQQAFPLTPADVVVQKTPYTFDVSAWEYFWPLMTGARLAVAVPGGHRDFGYLARLLASEAVTVTHFVPSVLRGFLAAPGAATATSLRTVVCSGEALPADVRDRALATWPHARLHNLYGPTEASIDVTAWSCTAADGPAVPIGTPIAGMSAYVLDLAGQPAPVGIPGELCLAGPGLARGYVGRGGLTAQLFTPCPFARPGQRMYHTGDLARWRPDGALDYLGRADDQIKIYGQRIEPGDIEHALTTCPGILSAAVTVRTTADGEPYLAAYLVTASQAPADHAIRAHLATRLPLHMIPATITTLPAIPLTASGKLDRAALPAHAPSAGHPPASPTQHALAAIWHDLLRHTRPITTGDNFFALGGSSLDLVRLAALVRERFGADLDPRELYLSPTLDGVAAALDARLAGPRTARPGASGAASPHAPGSTRPAAPGRPGATAGSLLPIRAAGHRPPLFLVHAVGGSAVPYVPLAGLLDPGQPVYGIQAPGLDGGATVDRLDDLVAGYLGLIREVQPAGPYLLGGWSVGGAIALELAARLRAARAEVALLALLDTVVPPQVTEPPDQADLLGSFCRDLAALRGACGPPLDPASLRRLPAASQVDTVIAALEQAGLVPVSVRDEVRRRFAVFAATTRALLRYRPRPFDRPVSLLEAAGNLSGKAARWRSFTVAGLHHHVVPGDHHTMLQPPHIDELASTLSRCLDRALRPCTP